MKMPGRYAALCLLAFTAACKPARHITAILRPADLPPRGPEKLVERLVANRITDVHYYSAKADVAMKDSSGSGTSFKARVMVVMDSAAWIRAIGPLGIEGGRVLLTADSLKLIDSFHDHHWVGDTAQARTRFGLQPSLNLFEQALLGMPIGFDPEEKYKSDREDGQYTLTNKEKRRFRRAAEDLAPDDTLPDDKDMNERRLERTLRKAERKDAVVYKYWLDPDSFRVQRVLITDLAHDQQADVRYSSRTTLNGHSLPDRLVLSLSSGPTRLEATLSLDRISLDGPLQLSFHIPEKSTPME